jgi:hypothetical protein
VFHHLTTKATQNISEEIFSSTGQGYRKLKKTQRKAAVALAPVVY